MPIETVYARKAGTSDWLAMIHIDDRSDLYRFYLGSRRFPTAPLARAWVTRRLRGTVPPRTRPHRLGPGRAIPLAPGQLLGRRLRPRHRRRSRTGGALRPPRLPHQ
jgi:hypothetical protein